MLSVGTFWHARSSAVSPRIDIRFAQNEAPVLGEHEVYFKMVLTHVFHCLRRFKCQGVDVSCRDFTYKTATQTQLIIHTTFLTLCDECSVCCDGCTFGL